MEALKTKSNMNLLLLQLLSQNQLTRVDFKLIVGMFFIFVLALWLLRVVSYAKSFWLSLRILYMFSLSA